MRMNPVVLALPAMAAAQGAQVPLMDQLKGWFDKATGALASAAPTAASNIHNNIPSIPKVAIPNPVDAAASQFAGLTVDRVTLDNYKSVLAPGAATSSPGIEDLMLFVTGGNKTCLGLCGRVEAEFNKSVPLIAASKNPPHLAILSCETDPVLCNAWAVGPPTILYMKLPQPLADQSHPATTVYSIGVNRTSVTAAQIAAIHTEGKYADKAPYEGYFHPFDGQLAKLGLSIPFGYAVFYFNKIPSWMFMVGISFFTRTFMAKRLQPNRGAGAPAAPASAPQ